MSRDVPFLSLLGINCLDLTGSLAVSPQAKGEEGDRKELYQNKNAQNNAEFTLISADMP